MKLRASSITLLLTLSLPAVLPSSWTGRLGGVAHAQQPGGDAVTEVARQRYEEGVKAYDQGRFEDARSAFLQAYALKRHPAVLLNLGLSEIKGGKYYEDGGNHLQQFLREHTAASADQKSAAEKGIAEAKKKTAFIVVIVDVNGAEVSLDGAAAGKSPLLDPVFVKPGKHTVLASQGGKSATTQVDAKVGGATAANVSLGGGAPPPVVPVPAPGPQPGTPGPSAPPGPAQPAPIGQAPPPAGQPGAYPPPDQPQGLGGTAGFSMGGNPQPDQADHSGDREPLMQWYTRKPIAWVGTGVAGLGLVGGIIFSVAAASASSAADDHAAQIQSHADADGVDKPCGPIDSDGSRDLPKYRDACNALRQDFSDHDTDVALAAVSWTLFGVGVVGTVTYAMIDWYPKKKPASTTTTGSLEMAPVFAPGYRGIGLTGRF